MSSNSDVVVVIPAYNEACTIREIAAAVKQFVPNVVVVDDGSTDNTSAALAGLAVTMLRHPRNQGKGAALRLGIEYALKQGAAAVLTLDGDGQHRPDDIPRLLEIFRRRPGVIVIGARLVPQDRPPLARWLANRFADFWISWAAGDWIADSQSGYRLYPASVLRRINVDRAHGFAFESEILIEACRRGYRTVPALVPVIYKDSARPSHFRPARDITRIVLMVAGKLLSRGFYPAGLVRALSRRRRLRRECNPRCYRRGGDQKIRLRN